MEINNLAHEMTLLKDEGICFWFHITSEYNVQSICEKGLYLDNNKITSTAQEVNENFYNNPENFINYDLGNPQTRQKEAIIIIGCSGDELKYLIKKNSISKDFIIDSSYILGYIDINTMYFYHNPSSLIEIDSYTL